MRLYRFVLNLFRVESLIPEKHRSHDLPSSKEIYLKTISIAWPSSLESLLIALISVVDMVMVSAIGTEAIAAVGIATQPRFLVMSLVLALNLGTTVVVARRKGANDSESANVALKNAFLLSITLAFITTLIGGVFAQPILRIAGATSDYITFAIGYYRIIMVGTFFSLVSLTISSAQRGVGNTRISMVINISANLVNIVFNYLLINGIWIFPRLGVYGAAIATSIGHFVGFVLALNSVMHKDRFLSFVSHTNWKLNLDTIKTLWGISNPAFIEQIFLRIGFLLYQIAVAGLGTLQFATHFIVMQMMSLSFSVGDGLSIATSSLVGQSLGAKRKDLAIIYGKVSQRIGMIAATILSIIIIVFRSQFMGFFTADPEIIRLGSNVMIMLAVLVNFQVIQVIIIGSLRGAGDVKFVAKLSMISVTILRPTLTFILAFTFGLQIYGAWISVILDQAIRYYVSRYRFHNAKWLSIEL